MNKRWITTAAVSAVVIATLGLAGCGASGTQQSANSGSNTTQTGTTTANAQVVHVTAQDFKWTLDKTDFKANQPIEFDITGKEGMHGFTIDGTSVSQPIGAGDQKKVTWTPPKAGTYTIRCNIYCGSGHDQMVTTFNVK